MSEILSHSFAERLTEELIDLGVCLSKLAFEFSIVCHIGSYVRLSFSSFY